MGMTKVKLQFKHGLFVLLWREGDTVTLGGGGKAGILNKTLYGEASPRDQNRP